MSQTFLIEIGEDNQVIHDFSFALKGAVDFQNWYENKEEYKIIYSKNPDINDCIPIGSIQFVQKYYEKFYNISEIAPINIPNELNKKMYLGRKIYKLEEFHKLNEVEKYFIKDKSKFKGIVDYMNGKDIKKISEDKFIVSDIVDFLSEYRCFILNGEILDIRRYSGDAWIVPDKELILEMVKKYKNSPTCYTLDVGVIQLKKKTKTVLIEVHPFFSCGLYGFYNYNKLINMFVINHLDIVKRKGIFE